MNLRKYILRHKIIFTVVILMTILGVLGQTISATFWTPMIDALAEKKSSVFWWWIAIDLTFALFRFGFGQLADYLQEKAKQSVNVDIQRDLVTGISNMSLPHFRNRTVGQYTSWLTNDIQQIDQKGLTTFFSIIMYSAGVIFPLISLALYHWSLCIVAIICGVIMTIAPHALQKIIENGSSKLTHTNESFVNSVDNTLNGFETLISFKRTVEAIRKISTAANKLKDVNLSYKKRELAVDVLTYSGSLLSQELLIALTGWLVLKGNLTAGSLMTTGQQAGIVFTSMAQLASLLVVRKAVNPVFEKYTGLKLEPVSDTVKFTGKPATFELQNVSSGTASQEWLRPVSATVNASEKIHLTGASGKGKTTLLYLIAGLVKPSSGEIIWHGSPDVLYVPQKAYIFNDTVRWNLSLGSHHSDESLWRTLAEVGLSDRIERLPLGLDTMISESGADLSGGERQRLALARALLASPGTLLFDESTSNVDELTAKKIENMILTSQNQTVIFVSHVERESNAELFDKVIRL